jgi:5-hydroxyisourate hydrolase
MPGISIHVMDVSRGVPCEGMEVALYSLDTLNRPQLIVKGRVSHSGTLDSPKLGIIFLSGRYRAEFQIGRFYRTAKIPLPQVPFIDVVSFDFGIDDPQQHFHLPMKCTPWGYSCFRGGA